jgi:hypothetical protein
MVGGYVRTGLLSRCCCGGFTPEREVPESPIGTLSSARGFPPDVLRRLVLTEADVNRVSQEAVYRPGQVSGLGDKLRLRARRLGVRNLALERKNRRARFLAKALKVRNRAVEFDKISGQKTAKVGINHLTILIQHGWLHLAGAGWTTLAR